MPEEDEPGVYIAGEVDLDADGTTTRKDTKENGQKLSEKLNQQEKDTIPEELNVIVIAPTGGKFYTIYLEPLKICIGGKRTL